MKINSPERYTQFVYNEAAYIIPSECKGGIAIDCGSNVGAFELRNKGRFDMYYCYEILKDNIDTMVHNLSGLGLNYKVENLACSGKKDTLIPIYAYFLNGTTDFFGNSGNVGTVLTCEKGEQGLSADNKITEVPSVTIEQILEQHNKVKILKVDIEGAEYEFLEGKDLSKIEYIVGEIHFEKERHASLIEHIKLTHKLIYYDNGFSYSFKNLTSGI